MKKFTLIFISVLFFAVSGSAKKIALYTPDWDKLNLDSYLKDNSASMEIKSLDPNKTGKNTYHIVSNKDEAGNLSLKMHLFDFDGDKKIDLVKHFEGGKLIRSEWNLDRDDKVEAVKLHKPEDGSVYLKVETDGKINIWSHYYKGELRLKEFDRNNDKKADMWYDYRGGKLYRARAAKNFNPKKVEDITKAVLK